MRGKSILQPCSRSLTRSSRIREVENWSAEIRDVAAGAARWITGAAIQCDEGRRWRHDARGPRRYDNSLYEGNAGPVLFLLESYRYTGKREFLETAEKGALHLLSSLNQERESGLYVGLAGIGFVLGQMFLVTGRPKYRDGTVLVVDLLHHRARASGRGLQWNDKTDIIFGGAGIGLFLLWAARRLKISKAEKMAVLAGLRIIDLGNARGSGRIACTPSVKSIPETPNFSHGTAGVAYFLATLCQQTATPEFLRPALAGARYLTSIVEPIGDGFARSFSRSNRKLYFAGWCHGPTGTARLFYKLFQITKDVNWMKWVLKMARGSIATAHECGA